MQGVVRMRILLFLATVIVVPVGTLLVILFAQGYRADPRTREWQPTGLLVAHSYPEGAQLYINGELRSATDSTLNLAPGSYSVEIKKEGYYDWKKQLTVEAKIVTSATAYLFPSVPSLKAVTSAGATNPVLSPESNKVVFSRKEAGLSKLFILDLNESPLGLLNREAKLIYSSPSLDFSKMAISWSPDSRFLLASASSAAYLVDINASKITDTTARLPLLLSEWDKLQQIRYLQKFNSLPESLQEILATSASNLIWSPNEDKLLYTATSSAVLPEKLIKPLPGSSTQPQQRTLVPNQIYVYDLEEDRNFLIGSLPQPSPTSTPAPKSKATKPSPLPTPSSSTDANRRSHPSGWSWFPTSNHLYKVEDNQVIVVEYDNQNQTIIYSGPLEAGVAFPYPSAKQLLILGNLNPTLSITSNLYAVSLR